MKGDTEQEMADKRYVGNRLRILREEHGLSQEKLAELLGITRQRVWEFETGSDHMRIGTLFAICDVLKVWLEDLSPERLVPKTDEIVRVFRALTEENRGKLQEYAEFLLSRQNKA